MSIIHSNGYITLPNGKTLPCIDFAMSVTEVLPSEEERRQVNEALSAWRGVRIDFAVSGEDGNAYVPTGPVVDSTLAGECEG